MLAGVVELEADPPSLASLLMFKLVLSPLTLLSLRMVKERISLPSSIFRFLSLFMARFLTVNVRGLRDVNKRSSFCQWLSQSTFDFACLQETHVPSSAESTSWFSPFGFQAPFLALYSSFFWFGSSVSAQVRLFLTLLAALF